MLAISWLAASDSGCPSDQAGESFRTLLYAEESVGVEPQPSAAKITQGVQGVADHHTHTSEARVEPVDRGLTLLEVVQIDPTPLHAILAEDWRGSAPVGVLDPGLVEDHALHPADDVTVLGKLIFGLAVEIDRIAPGHRRQEMPILGIDLDHVVDAGIVADLQLGEPKVGALAGVARHDVVDHHPEMASRHPAHRPKLLLGAEGLIDLSTDPVEMPIHARGRIPADQTAGLLDRTCVYAVDADCLESGPQILITERAEE